ncbi:sigma factor-like helix-turn-helix DNA-binding protein [Krasilnikovia sp. MM14-A1259]|uniref:sigma factor-like helix-turn-helix DNA-binding protein n=1 Tax=Krasilnikovia sp. MM14-A1259 TaxID=3373539 RepID=UPI00399D0DF6
MGRHAADRTAYDPEHPRFARRGASGPEHPGTTVLRAMDELSAAHRDMLVELFYRGDTLEAAAAVRGVSVETVKSRLYYALRALRAVLDRHVAADQPRVS